METKEKVDMNHPKLFISYSWSNQNHQEWVLNLATRLRELGVNVIIDIWDLKEGNDAVNFMEKMVKDSQIKKVVIICDEVYSSKANKRSGGVGTETQIISQEVYENQNQDKFVAVIKEKNEQGNPYLPIYYKSRIYIDLSEDDIYEDNFEKLIRWIYDKPLHKKPEMGNPPSYLNKSDGISLGTTAAYQRVLSAIKENKSYTSGAIDEYLTLFAKNLENFRITEKKGEFDEQVIDNIDKFIPYRNEIISFFVTLVQYSLTEENIQKVHRFFEKLIPYMDHTNEMGSWNDIDFDNFKFIIHELFLYVVAIFLKYEKFSELNFLLKQRYYVANKNNYLEEDMHEYSIFRNYLKSLSLRNERLELHRSSLHADLLKERTSNSIIEFIHLMQADFILFIRQGIKQASYSKLWYPQTLLYASDYRSFEVFARASSKSYFEKMKCILGIQKPDDLELVLNRDDLSKYGFESINLSTLLGYKKLAKTE